VRDFHEKRYRQTREHRGCGDLALQQRRISSIIYSIEKSAPSKRNPANRDPIGMAA
jgi:hypothetical protein